MSCEWINCLCQRLDVCWKLCNRSKHIGPVSLVYVSQITEIITKTFEQSTEMFLKLYCSFTEWFNHVNCDPICTTIRCIPAPGAVLWTSLLAIGGYLLHASVTFTAITVTQSLLHAIGSNTFPPRWLGWCTQPEAGAQHWNDISKSHQHFMDCSTVHKAAIKRVPDNCYLQCPGRVSPRS